jgi:hypothetical protein
MSELPKHISYSSFNTWLECGWKYNLTKLHDVPEKYAVWFTGGSAVHKATERYDKLDFGKATTMMNYGTMSGLIKSKKTKNSMVI